MSVPPNRKAPNPFLFVGISVLSFAAFYLTLQHRAATYPASKQPRQRDSPFIPPVHKEEDPEKKQNN
ncbi:hypothetical protein K474DRAFT_1599185 [Panus rudis PR-1116 ss-1]|nr:hypothetical protein K474DRAFT_1599185 [Panus rudis PR-1116 ss-1]